MVESFGGPPAPEQSEASLDFLANGGTLGALMRERDWSASPIGSPARWPPLLKNTVGMMLPAAVQIVLFWGPDFVALYNDSYAPTIGDKHPHALGRPAREHWSELWDDLEPLLRRVRERGETVSAEDRPFYIERHGHPETVYFDISYSPVRDDAGAIGGVLCLVKETTQKVLSDQQLQASEQRFHAMADSVEQMIWSTRADGFHDYYNQRWYDYTGVPAGSTDGEAWAGMFHPEDQERAWAVWRHSLETGEPYHIEYRLRHRSGGYRWVLGRAQAVRDESGAIQRWYGTCTDINDLKEAQERIRQSEEGFRAMVESLPIPAWVTAEGGGISFANKAFADFAGGPPETLAGEGWKGLVHADDLVRYTEVRDAALATASPFDVEVRARRADGLWRRMRVSARPRAVGSGGTFGYVGVAFDLTEVREAGDKLRESGERLRLAADATGIGIWDYDLTSGRLEWDDQVRTTFGVGPDTPVDYDLFLKTLHPSDRERIDAEVKRALDPQGSGLYDVDYRAVGAEDGRERWVAARGQAVFENDRAVRFIGTTLDITARKAVENALTRSEAELREQAQTLETLNRTANELSGDLDLKKIVQTATDNGVALTGAQFGAFFYNVLNDAGESYMLYTLSGARPDQFDFGMPRNTQVFHATFSGEGTVRVPDITKDPRYGKMAPHYGMPKGHLPVCSYLAVPVISASGEVIGGLFFGHEEPDRFSERHETLITGIAAQAAVAMDNARLYEAAQKELASRMRAEQELRLLNETLEQRVAQEVERRSEAEEALRQAQKMETLGQLTGGVAHDFNNLLQIVSGNIGLIQRNLPEESAKLRRAADNAARGAERAAVLTQRLLAFSRRQPLAPKPIDPNRLVGGMSELLHRTLGETIEVETVLSSGLWPVEVDPHQLENAILNLAINARDAMPDGGKLTIETCNTHLDRAYVTANAEVSPGQYVCICVTDSGVGMDTDTATRAFEPFFTTKEVGKGTGLGLSMVYGFVKQSGGHLKIYSEPGEGTTVKIYLPRLLGERPEVESGVEEPIPEGGHDETVLVCEDDEDVRAYTCEVLRELGYRVLEAGDGPSALRVLERREERIDLLFTDVVLPSGMTGAVLSEQARRLRPDLKVLFTTGYARNAIVHHGRLDPGVELITKPFSYADLAARVRDMLDGTGT